MSNKKLSTILAILDIAENNIKSAREQIKEILKEKGQTDLTTLKTIVNYEEEKAVEVVEGYFDGESMVGDNAKIYSVPQNYASKTQLVIGDRLKWILTPEREIFKLIKPAERERVIGTFAIEGDNFLVLVDNLSDPVKILKASATFAMKNLGLQPGDEVVIIIPKNATPAWGAFSSVAKPGDTSFVENQNYTKSHNSKPKTDSELEEFNLDDDIQAYF